MDMIWLRIKLKKRMNRHIFRLILVQGILVLLFASCSGGGKRSVTILETTDIHGVVLPYDFIEKQKLNYSLASCFTYVRKLRDEKVPTVLLDNGDNLQGQPEVYYYNFIDTVSPHFLAEAMNFMQYDAGTVGNHDIETGHAVYDRMMAAYRFPLLAANAVNISTGKPYFKPYHIIIRNGIRIAVFGLVTPAIPDWLPPRLYDGIEFRNMVATAKFWMPVIMKEKPDLVVGLFHSGWDKSDFSINDNKSGNENGSAAVAYNVPGFDIIFNGHDHRLANEKFVNIAGDTVLILNGGSHAEKMPEADITISTSLSGKKQKKITGKIINVADWLPDRDFIAKFAPNNEIVNNYVDRVIGYSTAEISSRDSYFSPSAFMELIHRIQLEITHADVSFAAPLSFDVSIKKGPITVGDMFKLYRFENMLYTVSMTGTEIKKYLEYSYAGWLATMKSEKDHLLLFRTDRNGNPVKTNSKIWLKNQPYNFDSASGINYTVDVSKQAGERISIKGFSDGRAFDNNANYKVAVNSYRGNGGGGHFTEGAGISQEELRKHLLTSTEKDLRFYILKYIEEKKIIKPAAGSNWKIIPEKWEKESSARDYSLLFK
jgi:2',3'-cyclic-nucleotide 2'-phosphodiesterase / 3'-nucleotidase